MVKKARLGADPFSWIQNSKEEKKNPNKPSNHGKKSNTDLSSKQEKPILQDSISDKPNKPDNQEKSKNIEKPVSKDIPNNLSNPSNIDIFSNSELQDNMIDKPSKLDNQSNIDNINKEEPTGVWQRATFIIKESHLEKIKAIAYWDRLQIKEVMEEALEEYLSKKDVKPIPNKRKI